ncbi:MAG: HlyD family efflux transporter periplasmic adaptor subunit [Ignavibacteriae bacterium]|nr:HlyD family efflux transporter periplasmic adaptor subunit [Ignavibacteriota bacterium]
MKIFPAIFFEKGKEFYLEEISFKSQIIYSSILLFLIFSFSSLPFIYVDTFTQARGIIKTKNENFQIVAPITGKLISLKLNDNQKVLKGDTLLVFDVSTIEAEIEVKKIDINRNKNYISDLITLIEANDFNISNQIKFRSTMFLKDYSLFLERINELTFLLERAQKQKERDKVLYQKDLISSKEFENSEYEFDRAVSQKEQLFKTSKSEWEGKLINYEQENRVLAIELEKLFELKRKYFVLAPIDGTIQELEGIQPNSYLVQNQLIANISPNDSLVAEIYISPKDIGFVRQGQDINIQMDAYNYREWGLLKGKVIVVSDDVVILNNSYFFKVICKTSQNFLELNYNLKGNLKKGMTFTANFLHNKRSLYNLLFDKIDDFVNPQLNNQN